MRTNKGASVLAVKHYTLSNQEGSIVVDGRPLVGGVAADAGV